jgi:RimJ/RimL family protein N-acetyltransferase
MEGPFVPLEFAVPPGLETELFRLEPLGPQHNDADYDAWTSSMDHIRTTPGWEGNSWPRDLTPEENLRDLESHAGDFEKRSGFTYTVLDPASGDVVGCVYIYPDRSGEHDARVRSWVRASRSELDVPLWRAVMAWLADDWPFESVTYADRGPWPN